MGEEDRQPDLSRWWSALEGLAPEIDANRVPHATARVFHDLLSDAFIWTDERPSAESANWIRIVRLLRPVWHHRTSLILETPEERTREHWERVCALCPNWIGLLADRRGPSKTLRRWYRMKGASIRRFLDDEESA